MTLGDRGSGGGSKSGPFSLWTCFPICDRRVFQCIAYKPLSGHGSLSFHELLLCFHWVCLGPWSCLQCVDLTKLLSDYPRHACVPDSGKIER